MMTPADKDAARALVARLERQADLHPDWGWAADHLEAAAMIRRLAGLGPRITTLVVRAAKPKPKRR